MSSACFKLEKKKEEDESEDKALSVKAADVKKAIKNAKTDGTSVAELTILKQWLKLSNEKDDLSKTLKMKRNELTDAVVKKYAALTEDEIKTLVIQRKWLASIISGCEALMQTVTHRISSDVTTLVERYETTLPELAQDVTKYEDEVKGYLKEMGFNL